MVAMPPTGWGNTGALTPLGEGTNRQSLAGDTLVDGIYRPIDIHRTDETRYWGRSAVLNLSLCWEEGQLRWWDPVAELYLETHDEEAEGRIAERQGRIAEQQGRIAERQSRMAAEVRADSAEARVRELEAELRRRERLLTTSPSGKSLQAGWSWGGQLAVSPAQLRSDCPDFRPELCPCQISHHHIRYLTAHPYRVVGAPVFRVYLGSVRQVQLADGGPVVGYLLAVVDADYWLRSVHLVVVVFPNPGTVELRVDFLQVGDELL